MSSSSSFARGSTGARSSPPPPPPLPRCCCSSSPIVKTAPRAGASLRAVASDVGSRPGAPPAAARRASSLPERPAL
eukprot:275352-Chlamydomonas_euryale.AAC.1